VAAAACTRAGRSARGDSAAPGGAGPGGVPGTPARAVADDLRQQSFAAELVGWIRSATHRRRARMIAWMAVAYRRLWRSTVVLGAATRGRAAARTDRGCSYRAVGGRAGFFALAAKRRCERPPSARNFDRQSLEDGRQRIRSVGSPVKRCGRGETILTTTPNRTSVLPRREASLRSGSDRWSAVPLRAWRRVRIP